MVRSMLFNQNLFRKKYRKKILLFSLGVNRIHCYLHLASIAICTAFEFFLNCFWPVAYAGYAGAYGPGHNVGPLAWGGIFNWNKGTNIEPCTVPVIVLQLIRIFRRSLTRAVSFFSLFLSSHYTAAVAARACVRSGAGSVAVIFPSERRAPFWRFRSTLSIRSVPLTQPKMPFGHLLVRESVE